MSDINQILSARETVREALKPHVDHDTPMDSGGGGNSADLWFWLGGTEYVATIRKVRDAKPMERPAKASE